MEIIIDATTTQTKAFAGLGQYTKNLVTHLVKQYPKDLFILLLHEEPSILDDFIDEKPTNIEVERVGVRLTGFSSRKNFIKRINPVVSKILVSYPEAVYFCPYFLAGFPSSRDIPVILTFHDLAQKKFNHYSDKGFPYNIIRKKEYNHWLRRLRDVDQIITDAEFTNRELLADIKRISKKYTTSTKHILEAIPLGIELDETPSAAFEKYLPADWAEKKYLIYLGGGIQKNKNSEGVVRAYSEFIKLLNKKGTEIENAPYLVIAGKIFTNLDAPLSVKLHELIIELDLKDKVIFTGRYEDSEKYSLLNNAFAFIHLSLYEGFGISVAEAMRAKVPVIVDNHSTYPEVVQDGGVLVDGTNFEECAKAVFSLYSNRELANELRIKGYNRSLELTWDKTALMTYSMIERVYRNNFGYSK